MCLTLREGYTASYVLRTHTLCWKVLSKIQYFCHITNRWKFMDTWVSPYQHAQYRFGKIKRAKLDPGRFGKINEGLHSYSDEVVVNMLSIGAVFPALIPAGARFFFDPIEKELASEQLVVFESLDRLKAAAGVTLICEPVKLHPLQVN